MGGLTKSVALVSILAISPLGPIVCDRAAASNKQDQEPVRFTILDADGREVIGRSEYRMKSMVGRTLLLGDNHYKDGEHDVERDELELNDGKAAPVLVSFEHRFFNSDGSQKLIAHADRRSGDASCVSYEADQKRELTKKLQFPSDTYPGAAAVLAMQAAFRNGHDQVAFHTFDCAPAPILAAVVAERNEEQHWGSYPGMVTRVGVTAKLGWLQNFLGGLLPHRDAWFDAERGWQYVGGKIQRYLATGPQVVLVREGGSEGDALRRGP
jgi:hypothetical protein